MVDPRQEIEIIRGQVKVSFNLTQAIQANNKQLLTSLENLIEEGLKQGFPARKKTTKGRIIPSPACVMFLYGLNHLIDSGVYKGFRQRGQKYIECIIAFICPSTRKDIRFLDNQVNGVLKRVRLLFYGRADKYWLLWLKCSVPDFDGLDLQ